MSDFLNTTTEAATIASLAQSATQANFFIEENMPVFSFSDQTKVVFAEKLLPTPLRNSGAVFLLTPTDLVRYLKNQTQSKDAGLEETCWNPVIFADRAKLTFTAILNYPTAQRPGWADNRAIVTLTKSRQLVTWQGKNAQKMSQEQFALFLEENIEDIRTPTGAQLLTFAETLEATRTETFKSSIITSTGEQKLSYCSERNGEQSSTLITQITLGIPLFEGGDRYAVEAKISHRVTEGKLTFWFDLRHIEHIIDRAWMEECSTLDDNAADFVQIYHGSAPSKQDPLSLNGF
jgi:uncharacterized protein YfdQ (DUF2303 family)